MLLLLLLFQFLSKFLVASLFEQNNNKTTNSNKTKLFGKSFSFDYFLFLQFYNRKSQFLGEEVLTLWSMMDQIVKVSGLNPDQRLFRLSKEVLNWTQSFVGTYY